MIRRQPATRREKRAAGLDPSNEEIIKREEGTWVWRETGAEGDRLVVKLYRHRGAWNAFRCRLTGYRTEREHDHLLHLVRSGVPCTVPLSWSRGRSPEHGAYEVLEMRDIPEAVQLADHLSEEAGDASLAELYGTVRRMHECGFCHQTLYATNVLVTPKAFAGARFFISDVPRSRIFPRSIVGTRMALLDLLDLMVDVRAARPWEAEVVMEAYGMAPRSRRWWKAHAEDDFRTKAWRTLRDAEARLRSSLGATEAPGPGIPPHG